MYSVRVNAPVCVLGMFNRLERGIYSVGVDALVFVLGIFGRLEREMCNVGANALIFVLGIFSRLERDIYSVVVSAPCMRAWYVGRGIYSVGGNALCGAACGCGSYNAVFTVSV